MPTPILTSTTTNGDVATYKGTDTTRDWVTNHNNTLTASRPSGDRLTTTWNSADGMKSRVTDRYPAESDESFMARHQIEYMADMLQYPPTP